MALLTASWAASRRIDGRRGHGEQRGAPHVDRDWVVSHRYLYQVAEHGVGFHLAPLASFLNCELTMNGCVR